MQESASIGASPGERQGVQLSRIRPRAIRHGLSEANFRDSKGALQSKVTKGGFPSGWSARVIDGRRRVIMGGFVRVPAFPFPHRAT